MKKYQPTIPQFIFGQPSKEYEVPKYVEAALLMIEQELLQVMWNITQEEFESPFRNTGNKYKCEFFEVNAYSWDDEEEQKYNFKWKDFELSWYKYYPRGMSMNRKISPKETAQMLNECISYLEKIDQEDYENC
jgi:hypothetical protein